MKVFLLTCFIRFIFVLSQRIARVYFTARQEWKRKIKSVDSNSIYKETEKVPRSPKIQPLVYFLYTDD